MIGYRRRYDNAKAFVRERFESCSESYVRFRCGDDVYTVTERNFRSWYKRVRIVPRS